MKTKKLSTTLFQYYLILPLVIMLATFWAFYAYASHILIVREEAALRSLGDSAVTAIDRNIRSMDQVSASVNYVNRRNSTLTRGLAEPDQSEMIREFIISQNGPTPKADQINIYSLDHRLYRVGIITKTEWWTDPVLPEREAVLALSGKKLVGTPYQTKKYSFGAAADDWYLSVFRAAVDNLGRPIAIIETTARCKNFFYPLRDYAQGASGHPDAASFYIFDDEGRQIYPYRSQTSSDSDYWKLIRKLKSDRELPSTVTDPVSGDSCRFSLRHSSYSRWNYLILQDESAILRPVRSLLRILVFLMILVLLFSVLTARLLTRNLVTPIDHLRHVIQRLRIDTVGKETVEGTPLIYQELRELYQEFQEMNQSLKKSLVELDQVKELEVRSRAMALQAQMNPHFYYNSLSCISILAEEGQTQEVSRMCGSLSMIMRYITDTSTATVTIEEELNYVRQYLYCMKIRYEDSLSFAFDVDPGLLALRIPKLAIQPLVENAIKYGTDCPPPWKILITGHMDPSGWYMEVSDSGNGFQSDIEASIRKRIQNINSSADTEELHLGIGGMGLLNLYVRWKLHAREHAVFQFGNTPEGHAFVRIGCLTPDRD